MRLDSSVLTTGASPGLGLELARQFAADGWRVYACARRPAGAVELAAIAAASGRRVTLRTMDLLDPGSIARAAHELGAASTDVLLIVSGTMGRADFPRLGVGAMPFGATD